MDEEQKKLAEELLFSEKKPLSVGKKLFFGEIDSQKIHPFPTMTEEERAQFAPFFESYKQFADEAIDPVAIDREAAIPPAVVQGLGKLGILGMTVPKEYGGLGMSQRSFCKIVEETAKRCSSTALLLNVHLSIGLRAILLFGTEQQKKQWLPKLASGEETAAFSVTEENAGSDVSGIETQAVYDPVKKVYILRGKKQWTSNGSLAKTLTVAAKTEGGKVTTFLVRSDTPGFHVRNASLEKLGMKGTWTANLEFKDMEIPEENVLGKVGGGLRVALTVLDYGRTTFGAMCTGAAKELFRLSLHHSKTRIQFKRKLASFGLVKKKIAQMAAYLFAMESTTEMTAGLLDQGEDVMIESAILKVFASDSLWEILYDAMQILGGRSFFTDAPYERMLRDARLNMIGEGANEVMRVFIAATGMRDVGMQLLSAKESLLHFWQKPQETTALLSTLSNRLYKPTLPFTSKKLESEISTLASQTRSFGWHVAAQLATHKEDIVEKQLLLDRITTMAISLYTRLCVLSKLESEKGKDSIHLKQGKLYCHLAEKVFDVQERGLKDKKQLAVDAEMEALAEQMT